MVQISSSTAMLTVAHWMAKRRRAFPYITSQSRFSSSRNLPESTDCSRSKGPLVRRWTGLDLNIYSLAVILEKVAP